MSSVIGEEGTSKVYSSYPGLGDIVLSSSRPFAVMPGSILLNQTLALPTDEFIVIFGEPIRLSPGPGANGVAWNCLEIPFNEGYWA